MASFALGLQSGVQSGTKLVQGWRDAEREKRLEAEYQREQEYRTALKEAGGQAGLENRQGYQVTGPDGQKFYVPTTEARDAYTASGYASNDQSVPYQEVNVGSRGLGQFTAEGGPPAGGALMREHNEGAADRMAAVAAQHDKPQAALSYMQMAENPLRRAGLAQALQKGKLDISALTRSESTAKKEEDALVVAAGTRSKLLSSDPNEVFAALEATATTFSASQWGGAATARPYRDEDGKIMIEFDPKNGTPPRRVPYTSALADQIATSQAAHLVNASSPAGVRRAAKELKEATHQNDALGVQTATANLHAEVQREQILASLKNAATQASSSKAQIEAQLKIHGPESPQGKKLAEELKSLKDYNDTVTGLIENRDRLTPQEVAIRVDNIKMKHPDKGHKAIGVYENGVKVGERLVSVFEQFLENTTTSAALAAQADATAKYGPDAGLRAIPQPGGTIGWKSARTGALAFTSLEEVAKAGRFKPVEKKGGKKDEAAVRFPYVPSGEMAPRPSPGLMPYNLNR